jgi:hypothetical protein
MSATRTANDDRTMMYAAAPRDSFHALDDLVAFDTRTPVLPVLHEAYDDDPTVMAAASYDSEELDARALFGDVLNVPTPCLPPPLPASLPPSFPPSLTPSFPVSELPLFAGPVSRRENVTTARTRKSPAWIDSRNAPLTAVVVCGMLAALAAVAAAVVF